MKRMRSTYRWTPGGGSSFLALGILLLMLLPICGCQRDSESRRPAGPPALDVASTNLLRTRVVATLDAPLLPGTNLIWCASFQLAWKELAAALEEKQPMVEGAETLCRELNVAPDPHAFLSAENYYTAAGWVTPEFVARIRSDMGGKFPSVEPLRGIGPLPPDNLAAYAYLEASMPFAIPYFDSKQPVAFRESGGREVKVRTFGIGDKEKPIAWGLRRQVQVLFGKNLMSHQDASGEFAVDPFKQSSGVQLVVACVKPQATLAATLHHVCDRVDATKKTAKEQVMAPPFGEPAPLAPGNVEACPEHAKKQESSLASPAEDDAYYPMISDFGASDTLVIPEMDWRILHHFAELEWHRLANSNLQGQPITLAVQDIAFRLDRHGAMLRSQAAVNVPSSAASVPTHFEFTQPFLVILKKHGADQPFFVAWIDNAELLRRWE